MDLAVSKGADRQFLAQRSHINPDDLLDRDKRIALKNYQALMEVSKAQCSEPALALQLGEATVLSEISIVGLISRCSASTVEAFEQINRYGRLVVEVDGHRPEGRFRIVRVDGELWLEDTRRDPNSFPELTESAFAMMICMPEYKGHKSFAKAVHFTHAEPSDRSEYERILKSPVLFGCKWNAILLDAKFMSLKLPKSDKYTFGIFSERANALLESLKKVSTIRGQVEALLIPILHTGALSMESIAEALGLGRQTLYRKLKAEGTSYEKLLDELRHKMALHYLSGKKVSVNQTAYLTGYSEPSAFSRAFKRWTGESPKRGQAK